MSLSARLLHAWQGRGLLACALWPASLIYGTLLLLRRWLYALGLQRSTRLPVPVLVVGNVVVGGTGKTPTVIALIQHLRERGWSPGVISRGHGRQSHDCQEVTADSTSEDVGDEPRLIAQHTGAPMVVGHQRVLAAQTLLRLHPEVNLIISDDGMQHWALARDLTVVVFDDRGTGNGWLLPAGMLREPWPARPWGRSRLLALRNTSSDLPARLPEFPNIPYFVAQRRLQDWAVASNGQHCALNGLAQSSGRPLAALAGIAQPETFFTMLRKKGLPLAHTVALPDHADAATLFASLMPDCTWLCTEKDAVKLFPLLKGQNSPAVCAVPLVQTPEFGFFAAVDKALDGLSSAHGRQTP